jgi:(+)-neomenthol dehydrogenase
MRVDRVAVVTGGNRGIGYEIVRQLQSAGCTVVLTARDYAKAVRAARSMVDSGGRVVPRQLDVTDPHSVARLATSIQADTPVWLALLPDDGPTGGLFRGRQRIPW